MSDYYHHRFYALGTRIEFIIIHDSYQDARQICEDAERIVSKIEREFNCNDPESIIAEINKNAASKPVHLNDETWYIMNECMHYHDLTNGIFDVTVYPQTRPQKRMQSDVERDTAFTGLADGTPAEVIGMKRVTLHEEDHTIFFNKPGMAIDLGGYGKGYAMRLVNNNLKAAGIDNAFLSFGESSIMGLGRHPHGDCWKVRINALYSFVPTDHVFELKDQSISSSASFEGEGNMIHIFDPREMKFINERKQVTVRCHDPVAAEVLSTSLIAAQDDEQKEIMSRFIDCDAVEISIDENDSPRVKHI